MKTIRQLAEENNVSYRIMWDRLARLRRQLTKLGDERAEKLFRKRNIRFGGKERVLVDDELLRQILEEM